MIDFVSMQKGKFAATAATATAAAAKVKRTYIYFATWTNARLLPIIIIRCVRRRRRCTYTTSARLATSDFSHTFRCGET